MVKLQIRDNALDYQDYHDPALPDIERGAQWERAVKDFLSEQLRELGLRAICQATMRESDRLLTFHCDFLLLTERPIIIEAKSHRSFSLEDLLEVDRYRAAHPEKSWLNWRIDWKELDAPLPNSAISDEVRLMPKALRDLIQVVTYADIMWKDPNHEIQVMSQSIPQPIILLPRPETTLGTGHAGGNWEHPDGFFYYPVSFRVLSKWSPNQEFKRSENCNVPFVPLTITPFVEWLRGNYVNTGFPPHGGSSYLAGYSLEQLRDCGLADEKSSLIPE
jgi:hypothetical protein